MSAQPMARSESGRSHFSCFCSTSSPTLLYNPPPSTISSRATRIRTKPTGLRPRKRKPVPEGDLGDAKAIERLTQLYDGRFISSTTGRADLEPAPQDGPRQEHDRVGHIRSRRAAYSHRSDCMTFDHRFAIQPGYARAGIVWGAGIPRGRVINAPNHPHRYRPHSPRSAGLPPKPIRKGKRWFHSFAAARRPRMSTFSVK